MMQVNKNADGTMIQNEMMELGSADSRAPELAIVYNFTGWSTERWRHRTGEVQQPQAVIMHRLSPIGIARRGSECLDIGCKARFAPSLDLGL
jgi:hypothetical protein